MKVTIITVVLNCQDYIVDCIESVLAQDYPKIEYIIIDGGSTDATVRLIDGYLDKVSQVLVEKDNGIYDALNKGLKLATGEIVGILNADDFLADSQVISSIVNAFGDKKYEAVYSNLNFIDRQKEGIVTRQWVSKAYDYGQLKYGWMPAHPTLYLRRDLFSNVGLYSLDFGMCADYEFVLRLFYNYKVRAAFLNKLTVIMRNGGASNGSLKKVCLTAINDYKALRKNKMPYPLIVMVLKKMRKLSQLYCKRK